MRHWFFEDWFDAAGRLPHKAADRAFRAYASRAAPHGTQPHRRSGGTALLGKHRRPGAPRSTQYRSRFARRRDFDFTDRDQTLTQPVLPRRQDPVVEKYDLRGSAAQAPPDEHSYRDADGLITMCVSCHRMQRPGTDAWDSVPQWEASLPAEVTGGLCVACFQQHYARYLPQSDDAVA